jgi:hypothetical protein
MKKGQEPELIYSEYCQDVMVDGYRFEVNIVSSDIDPAWCLEVVDIHGMSHVWEATFETDSEALEAAMIAFNDEGAAEFLQPDTNVIPFPGGDSDERGG